MIIMFLIKVNVFCSQIGENRQPYQLSSPAVPFKNLPHRFRSSAEAFGDLLHRYRY